MLDSKKKNEDRQRMLSEDDNDLKSSVNSFSDVRSSNVNVVEASSANQGENQLGISKSSRHTGSVLSQSASRMK